MKKALIIGTGGIGKRHIRGFLKTGRASLTAIEPDQAKLEDVLGTYEIETGYADLGDADLSRYDLAIICAPAHVHVPLAQTCALAGLPFLMEKPLAVNMDGVDRLLETVNSKGLVARIGYVRRAGQEHIDMRQQILDGRIGELRMCYMNASQEYPKYRPDYREIYYAKKAMGGGAVLDCASHFIDYVLWVMGEVEEVSAMYDRLQLTGVEAEDSCLISLRFKNGCMAQININQFQKPNINTIEMIGTRGNLLLDVCKLRFAHDDSGNWEEHDYMAGLAPMEAHEARFRFQADMFMDAVDGQPDHLATLEDARDNLRVALAAKESYETKRIIQL